MDLQKLYNEKLCSVEEAVSLIKPGYDLITPILAGEPYKLMKQLESHEGLGEPFNSNVFDS